MRIPVQNLKKIIIRIKRGDIRVIDATAGNRGAIRLPALDLVTADGVVQKPGYGSYRYDSQKRNP